MVLNLLWFLPFCNFLDIFKALDIILLKKKYMKKFSAVILVVLGLYMIYLGGVKAPKLMLPPVISGIGFLVIAIVFFSDKK